MSYHLYDHVQPLISLAYVCGVKLNVIVTKENLQKFYSTILMCTNISTVLAPEMAWN